MVHKDSRIIYVTCGRVSYQLLASKKWSKSLSETLGKKEADLTIFRQVGQVSFLGSQQLEWKCLGECNQNAIKLAVNVRIKQL